MGSTKIYDDYKKLFKTLAKNVYDDMKSGLAYQCEFDIIIKESRLFNIINMHRFDDPTLEPNRPVSLDRLHLNDLFDYFSHEILMLHESIDISNESSNFPTIKIIVSHTRNEIDIDDEIADKIQFQCTPVEDIHDILFIRTGKRYHIVFPGTSYHHNTYVYTNAKLPSRPNFTIQNVINYFGDLWGNSDDRCYKQNIPSHVQWKSCDIGEYLKYRKLEKYDIYNSESNEYEYLIRQLNQTHYYCIIEYIEKHSPSSYSSYSSSESSILTLNSSLSNSLSYSSDRGHDEYKIHALYYNARTKTFYAKDYFSLNACNVNFQDISDITSSPYYYDWKPCYYSPDTYLKQIGHVDEHGSLLVCFGVLIKKGVMRASSFTYH